MELPEGISKLLDYFYEKFTEQDIASYNNLPLEIRSKLESGDPTLIKEGLAFTMKPGVKIGWAGREYIQTIIEVTKKG